jgi:phenylalanyl-tRNA synthetase alpha chain
VLDEILNKIQGCSNLDELEAIRVESLGKKGFLTLEFAKMKDIPGPEKKAFAENLNKQKEAINNALEEKKVVLDKVALEETLKKDKIDVTRFNNNISAAALHPVAHTMNRVHR